MHRFLHRTVVCAAVLTMFALSACGGDDTTPAADDSPSPTTSESESPAGATIATSTSDLGEFLVDDKGMTLYMFTQDSPNTSVCEGDCLAAWPALAGPVEAGDGVDAAQLGTTTRSDGTEQATYNGWPLYYWVQDKAPGDVTGQGVGTVWYVLDPAGTPIGMPAEGAELTTAKHDLGTILVDAKGMTLYMFTEDTENKSNCAGDCLTAWPPYEGPVFAGEGVDGSLVGTTEATDGSVQVTYNGWPLYYWQEDKAPGDATGQAVGEVWYVLNAKGTPIGR